MEKKKRILISAGILLFVVITVTATITGHIFLRESEELKMSGDGYYEIHNVQEYEIFWDYVHKKDAKAKGRLYSDIYLNDTSDLDNWYKNPPQNRMEGIYQFEGAFDGNGYTIYGLYSEKGYGITYDNKGRIENLTIKDSLIAGKNDIGGICSLNDGVIRSCSFQGKIEMIRGGIDKPNDVSGICLRNRGLVQRCEFAGEMPYGKNAASMITSAGICMENEGEIRDCYNLTMLENKGSKLKNFAISDGGEVNCYMKEDSGWEVSSDGQILALNQRQCWEIDNFLKNGLYEYYFPANQAIFAMEKPQEPMTIENVPLREALQDVQIAGIMWKMVNEQNASWDDFTFAAFETDRENEFILDLTCKDETIRIVRNISEEDVLWDLEKISNEELWRTCTEILQEQSLDSWEHETYRLCERKKDAEKTERIVLYQTGNEETGFFLAAEKQIYQFIFPEGNKETLDLGMKIEESLGETVFWKVVGDKAVDTGIDWKEDAIRELVYKALEKEGELLPQEEIGRLTSLTINMRKLEDIRSLKDLEYLTGLEILTVHGSSDEMNNILQNMWSDVDMAALSNLEELNMIGCGLKEISFVESLPQLTSISFYENEIEDISPLAVCKGLKILSLAYNEISDITPLSQLSKLEELGLQYNDISDAGILCKLNDLVGVNLTANRISDLAPFEELTNLTNLGLAANEIVDISPLASLKSLYNLSLDANQIQDISPLFGMTEMEWLGLSWNQIQDFTPIQGMEKLFFLSVTDNPSQDIGDLILTPDLSIGTWYTDRTGEMEALNPLLDSAFPGHEIEIEDFATGDMNGDGISDVAITGYSGEVRAEDGSISQWGERNVYLFLGSAQGAYIYRDKVEVMGPDQGGMYGDPYEGIAIAGGKLVIKCYGGSNFRWGFTDIYEWETGGLTLLYELSLDNWIGGNGGYDWYVTDVKAGTEKKYAIVGTLEGNMEKVLLRDSAYEAEESRRQSVIDEEIEILKGKLRGGAVVPEIISYFYEPDIGSSYYEYEIHTTLYDVTVGTDRVLREAAGRYLPGAVELEIPLYAAEEIKYNYDVLAGVELPDSFYLGEKYGVPYLLIYKRCEVTQEGEYVHVCTLRKKYDDDWWLEAGTIYYYEDTDCFAVEE